MVNNFNRSHIICNRVTKRQGKVEDGNTLSDFDKEEIARKVSIGTAVIPAELEDTKFNF